jgi:cytochrome c5
MTCSRSHALLPVKAIIFAVLISAILPRALSQNPSEISTNQPPDSSVEDADHVGMIQAWNADTLVRGEKLYRTLCMPCHGTPQQQGSLPASRAFWKEPFKNGNDPFSIYKTIGKGLGQMPAWPWLGGELRYDIIDYIRETFVRPNNPTNYFVVNPAYLASLPKGSGRFVRKSDKLIEFEKGPKYLRMDFGPVLNWTYEGDFQGRRLDDLRPRYDACCRRVERGPVCRLERHRL